MYTGAGATTVGACLVRDLCSATTAMAYRIKSVSALTGLTTSTLRAWERRYGLLTPERSSGGYRLYTDDDVARLSRIKSLLDNGFKVSEAIALVEREAPPLTPSDASEESLEPIRAELLDAVLQMDRPRANRVADRLASLTFERRVDEILLPVVREVGTRWASGIANIAQEHFTSSFVSEKLAGMLAELGAGPATGREVVCAGLPGERHEIGLLAAAVHLALKGWRVTYVGADLPFEDLRESLARRPPALLCTAMVQHRNEAESIEAIRRLREAAPPETRIVIGGQGIPAELLASPNGIALFPTLDKFVNSPILNGQHS
jgi:MerR family transcriptional regulator, light-induced transcriptional regulator